MLTVKNGRFLLRLGIITSLLVVYFVAGLLTNITYPKSADFSHFGYIPIVLSGLWWNRKAVIVASILGLMTLVIHRFSITQPGHLDFFLIPVFFIFIAFFIGTVSKNLKAKHNTLIETEKKYLFRELEAEQEKKMLSEVAKRQEDQLVHSARLAELGEMAAGMAHELNQPLTGIKNFAKNALFMLEQGADTTDDVKDNLSQISRQVDRAARIINQMRELARITERQFVLLNINDIVRDSVEFLKPHLKNSGIETTFSPTDNLPLVKGDKIRLEQVFLNIITNAKQSMENTDERRLSIRTYLDEASLLPVVVDIMDTGRGFRQDEAEKLFTPFYTTKKPGQGTGLGLSISLTIIQDHHGAIETTGAVGEGALFKVRLPIGKNGQS